MYRSPSSRVAKPFDPSTSQGWNEKPKDEPDISGRRPPRQQQYFTADRTNPYGQPNAAGPQGPSNRGYVENYPQRPPPNAFTPGPYPGGRPARQFEPDRPGQSYDGSRYTPSQPRDPFEGTYPVGDNRNIRMANAPTPPPNTRRDYRNPADGRAFDGNRSSPPVGQGYRGPPPPSQRAPPRQQQPPPPPQQQRPPQPPQMMTPPPQQQRRPAPPQQRQPPPPQERAPPPTSSTASYNFPRDFTPSVQWDKEPVGNTSAPRPRPPNTTERRGPREVNGQVAAAASGGAGDNPIARAVAGRRIF